MSRTIGPTRLSSTVHVEVGLSDMPRLVRESVGSTRSDAVITLTPHAEAALLEWLLIRKENRES